MGNDGLEKMGYTDTYLSKAYRAMIPNHIAYIKDKDGDREYIDLAYHVFMGMPNEYKQQYSELLAKIIEKKNINGFNPDFWRVLSSVNPAEIEPELCDELKGTFKVIENVVDELQEKRVNQGKDNFSITEDEIMNAMGITDLNQILEAVYYPKTEIVQKHYDVVVNTSLNTFGKNPIVSSQDSIKK